MRLQDFYRDHGFNSGEPSVRKICRNAVKEYVKRIRGAFAVAFQRAALPLDPMRVLVSEATDDNEVQYHLQASIEWLHVDDLAERYSRIRRGN
jgi:geranylgeranyl pyrophosphate synthase